MKSFEVINTPIILFLQEINFNRVFFLVCIYLLHFST